MGIDLGKDWPWLFPSIFIGMCAFGAIVYGIRKGWTAFECFGSCFGLRENLRQDWLPDLERSREVGSSAHMAEPYSRLNLEETLPAVPKKTHYDPFTKQRSPQHTGQRKHELEMAKLGW
ncbi:hypothetical protein BCR34DRAFT_597531 [Clohesyomyces aquaticus]|uniref:Uncharacterized protein n=1 Tax=Clohesyomyces aquaticus TaxID=1231657 RepID=A0A1Y2A369_9PLEO|nr:hypothetical protein BCR34DRAFT_597531 [Clohesyomyces aquaticus]